MQTLMSEPIIGREDIDEKKKKTFFVVKRLMEVLDELSDDQNIMIAAAGNCFANICAELQISRNQFLCLCERMSNDLNFMDK